jgi:hypothetical protein
MEVRSFLLPQEKARRSRIELSSGTTFRLSDAEGSGVYYNLPLLFSTFDISST